MYNIYLLKYNNKFNRIVKKPYPTLGEYLDSHEYQAFWSIEFIPNDWLTTSQKLNFSPTFEPDYCIVEDIDTGSFTRWFITESVRIRGWQYNINLKRDILTDFYEEVKNATAYITKGYVGAENPLIFNAENVLVNQIKKKELPIKDGTNSAWIVGYLAPDLAAEGDVEVPIQYEQETIPDISDFDYSEYVNKELKGLINNEKSYFAAFTQGLKLVWRYFNGTGGAGDNAITYPQNSLVVETSNTEFQNVDLGVSYSVFNGLLTDYLGNEDYINILNLEGKIYNDNGVYKRVTITKTGEHIFDTNVTESNAPSVYQEVTNALTTAGIAYRAANNTSTISIPTRIYHSNFILTLEEVGSPITSANVTFKSTIKKLKDAPYKMFCIPVAENAICRINEVDVYINRDKMIQIASSIATQLKTGNDGFLYDLQLLPYCPFESDFIHATHKKGIEYVGTGVEHVDYDVVRDSNENAVGYIFYANRSSFTINSKVTSVGSYPSVDVNNSIDFKVKNETHMFRLVSPNYSNFNDFNIFKNYGINYFNIDCTYKPYTPYIKVNINYKGLYGQDFNDQRGLICGGDYSLPVVSDSWVNYQIQNKNYANIFERENQNLEYQHKWGMASAVTGAAVGTVAGAFMGKALGSAGLGAGVSAGGGLLDVISRGALHGEQMDYRRDMFNFNIQNIQALPQGLVKTSAFNYNSKIWPFVEIYSCTEEETEVVRNKIIYTGMTLNVVGSIKNYLNDNGYTYIQGNVIRIDVDGDSHIANAINQELNTGVYYE